MNINNLTMSHAPQNIVKNTFNAEKDSFANMLIDAAGNFRLSLLLGKNESSLPADNTASILNEAGDTEDNEAFKKIDYGNLCGMWDVFFHLANQPTDDVSQSIVEISALESQFPYGGGHTSRLLREDIEFIKQDFAAEDKAIFENVASEKPISENAAAEQPVIENMTAKKSMLEGLTSEKIIFKNITAEKTVPESRAEDEAVQDNMEPDLPEAALRYMSPAENKIISVTDESSEIRAGILSQVRDKIIITAEKGMTGDTKTISMQLQPQNLGKIDIKLIYENDRLTVEIKALNEETQKILSSNTGELKEMLSKTSPVKILVKPFAEPDNHHYQNTHGSEPYFYQGQEHNHRQGRQQNNYYYKDAEEEEKGIFSELMNSSALKEDIIGS